MNEPPSTVASPRPGLAVIAAVSKNGVIGSNGALPWHISEDLKHFKTLTTGHAVIMGRKTYESIGRPLPNRRNIVVTRNAQWSAPNVEVAGSLADAVVLAQRTDPLPFVIGGAELYREALRTATHMYLTHVPREVEGDVYFPELNPELWIPIEQSQGTEVSFVTLQRKGVS